MAYIILIMGFFNKKVERLGRYCFDANIILDIALKRDSFFEDAFKLFRLIDHKKMVGSITASTITDIYYISKKESGHEKSIDFLKDLIEVVEIIGVDKEKH